MNRLIVSRGCTLFANLHFHTALLEDKNTYLSIEKEGEFRMGELLIKSKSIFKVGNNSDIKGLVGKLDLRFEAVMSAESIDLTVGILNIESGARITTSAVDRPDDTVDEDSGKGRSGEGYTGAGHASDGGYGLDGSGNLVPGGSHYGNLFKPLQRGARGGAGSGGAPGMGAGVIQLSVSTELFVDGTVECNGGDATGSNGGGSGGSIYVQASALEGHGSFQVKGGSGGRGGSGGIISVYVDTEHHFHGDFNIIGGPGSETNQLSSAGQGVVYIEEIKYGRPYRVLKLDNNNHDWDHCFLLDIENHPNVTLEELHIYSKACLKLSDTGETKGLAVARMYGDRTGRLHAMGSSMVELERGETAATFMKSPVNLWLDNGAKAYLATITYIVGVGEVAFNFNGEIIGVQHLRIMPERNVEVGETATTSRDSGGDYVKGEPGEFMLSSFELGSGCVIDFPLPMPAKFTIGYIVSINYIL